jgi:hypothetical protein
MRVHLDALAWLHVLMGAVGVLCGVSLLVLTGGTATLSRSSETPAAWAVIWLLAIAGVCLTMGGLLLIVTGRALAARQPAGRRAALLLSVPTLCVLPFGTALAIYTLWALLNDDARAVFGRPLRRHGSAGT